jgi:quercetin dioxygenase-like cupin family protein
MKSRSRLALLVVALASVAAVAAGTVYAISVEVPARGTFASHKEKTNLLRGVARLQGRPTDAAVQKIVLAPGEGPSWHTHAGPVTVIVKSGSFTLVDGDDCSETTYTAGQVFVDEGFGHVHRAFNPGPGTTEVWAFYVIPRGAGLIIPTAAPACAT